MRPARKVFSAPRRLNTASNATDKHNASTGQSLYWAVSGCWPVSACVDTGHARMFTCRYELRSECWTGNEQIAKDLKITPILDRLLEYKRSWIQHLYIYIYLSFITFFYVVHHLDSTASYLPTGLHLGFFRSWPSLYLPSSFLRSSSCSLLFWHPHQCYFG